MLLAVLRANGLIAVSSGPSTYRVIPDDTAAQQPGSAANGNLGFATQVFTLQRVDARSAAEILKPLIGRGGVIMAMPQGNSLLIADYADNLRRIRTLVAQIDTDRAAIDTVTLRNSSAQELARTLTSLFGQGGERSNVLSVLPVDSSNSLIVRGDPHWCSAWYVPQSIWTGAPSAVATSAWCACNTPVPSNYCRCCSNWSARLQAMRRRSGRTHVWLRSMWPPRAALRRRR